MEATEAAAPAISTLTRVYIKIRVAIGEKTKELDALEEQKKEVAAAIKDALVAAGCKSMRTDYGTISMTKSTRYFTNDWPNYDAWLLENKLAPSSMFEHRIAQKNMALFLEENPGVVPPGLNSNSEYSISVRKPTK